MGDAAYAPSFMTGQGSSLALVGAYVLAAELAVAPDHTTAFAGYEHRMRGFVDRNQALVSEEGSIIAPRTAEELDQRDTAVRAEQPSGDDIRAAASALTLPE